MKRCAVFQRSLPMYGRCCCDESLGIVNAICLGSLVEKLTESCTIAERITHPLLSLFLTLSHHKDNRATSWDSSKRCEHKQTQNSKLI